jgi:manganese efflux pump family protein
MSLSFTLLAAVGLAMDCFAVSLGAGTTRKCSSPRAILRMAFHFGLFQGLMTLVGWLAGSTISAYIAAFDHWVVLALLGWVGVRMVRSGLDPECEAHSVDPSRGRMLVMLSFATSIDALAVGLSLAFLSIDILSSSLIIGLVTLGLSAFGLLSGHLMGQHFGKRMEIIGGLLLIAIGLSVVVAG